MNSSQSEAPLITIGGQLDLSDAIEFMRRTSAVREAVVILRSPGGSLLAGLQIGRTIRQRGFLTLIPAFSNCSSACALAWLGGTPRFMARNSLVGFHGAYFMTGSGARASGTANAAIEDYLRGLQLSERAITYMIRSPPEKLAWLTVAAARDLGIDVGIYGQGALTSTLDTIATAPDLMMKRLESIDLLGHDLPGMPISAGTASDCEALCKRTTQCGAFTFNTKSAACFLKSGADLGITNPVATSGYRESPNNHFRRIDMVIQEGTDYPGNDIGRQTGTTFEACLLSCSGSATCRAFTYVVRRHECWLKNGIGSAEPRDGLVSGIK